MSAPRKPPSSAPARRSGEHGLTIEQAVAEALEKQKIADHTADQDDHLQRINGSIERTAVALEALTTTVAGMEEARKAEVLVNQTLAGALTRQQEMGLTTKRLWIAVAAIVVPVVASLLVVIFKG